MKKRTVLVTTLLILSLSVILLFCFSEMSYNLSGTYSTGIEPDEDNIYVVLKNEHFTIYNQEKTLETGQFEEVNLHNKSNIYKLVSEENHRVGYIVHDKNHITLLDFMNKDFSLKKISTNAVYLGYESEE